MQRARGFTLIELVIALAVAAILGAAALPAYSDHVRRSRAAAAVAVLKDLRARMEQRYADERTYAGAAAGGCGIADFSDPDSGFRFTCTAGTGGQSYAWTAEGTSSAMAGFGYSIDEAGLESTHRLPPGWAAAGLTLPVSRFVIRRGG